GRAGLRRDSHEPLRGRLRDPAAEAPVWPRKPGPDRPVRPVRELPPEPTEHLHREAHAADAAVGAAPPARRYFLKSLSKAARASSGVARDAGLPVRSNVRAGA